MKILAVIPARGGSKSVPRKNVKMLAGKPLLAYTIEAAKATPSVERVVVSTDDAEIALVAERFGAEVVWRPHEISGDTASSESALLHTLEFLADREKYRPDILVFLQCTSALMSWLDIQGTIDQLVNDGADSAFAATAFHYFLWKDGGSGVGGINHDASFRPRRQDREAQYQETGAVYVMRAEGFQKAKFRFFGKTVMHGVPAERSLEIDEPIDFRIAEMLLHKRRDEEHLALLPDRIDAVVFDFDGVFTDNKVIVREDGSESVVCDRSDGLGIEMLREAGIPMFVLSREQNPVVAARSRKLGIECVHGEKEKDVFLKRFIADKGWSPENVVYVGNDLNDVTCMEMVGCPVAVADAYPEARMAAKIVLAHAGGKGAVRELCDLILLARIRGHIA